MIVYTVNVGHIVIYYFSDKMLVSLRWFCDYYVYLSIYYIKSVKIFICINTVGKQNTSNLVNIKTNNFVFFYVNGIFVNRQKRCLKDQLSKLF